MAAATVSARGVFSTLFFWDSRCTCWARIWSTASTFEYTFARMHGSGDWETCGKICACNGEMCGLLSAPSTPSFPKSCWSASFWKYRKWVAGHNAHRGKGNSAVKPHYQAPHPKTMGTRSPTVWVSKQSTFPTLDTDLTIDVRNFVAKIRKSKIIELSNLMTPHLA